MRPSKALRREDERVRAFPFPALQRSTSLSLPLISYLTQPNSPLTQMIVITSPSKPLTYTAKGTIRRQASIKEYAAEIDAAYDAVRESSQEDVPAPVRWDAKETRSFVRKVVRGTMKGDLGGLGEGTDLFEVGLDRYVYWDVLKGWMELMCFSFCL